MTHLLKYLTEHNIEHQVFENDNEMLVQVMAGETLCLFKQSDHYPHYTNTRIGGYEAKNQSQRYMTRLVDRVIRGVEIEEVAE